MALMATALLVWHGLKVRAEQLERAETARLAAELAPALKAEEEGAEGRAKFQARLGGLTTQSPAASALARGALAFFDDDPAEAARLFGLASAACPDDPHLPSFQAAAYLRLDDPARALDLYLRAMDLKTKGGITALSLADDEMGAALALFFLGRIEEARQYAEKAWRTRLAALGPDDPETLAAANRLATALVSLGLPAEDLLRETYQRALAKGEEGAEALGESRLLLTVLYHQYGRQAELEEFFDQALASAAAAGRRDPPVPQPPPVPESPTLPQGPPELEVPAAPVAEPGRRPDWEGLARSLAGRNEALAADLWARQIEALAGRPEEQRLLRRELVRSALASGQAERALAELGAFTPLNWAEAAERALWGAEALAGLGRWPEAINGLTRTAESLGALQDKARQAKGPQDPALANLGLEVHLKLAELYLKEGRVPQEAEIELRSALGRLDRQTAALCPLVPEINLRLGRLTRAMGRPGDSREFYKRARAGAEAQLKAKPGPAVRAALGEVVRAAAEESGGKTGKAAAPPPASLPEPELLRLEMSALAALGRLEEFPARLRPVLEEAARRHGPGAREHLLYYSLELKWLEKSGRVEELTLALEAQAADPPGLSEAEKLLNRGGALFYAARINEKAGRGLKAADLYRAALAAWLEVEGDARLAGRRAEAEAALSRLAAP